MAPQGLALLQLLGLRNQGLIVTLLFECPAMQCVRAKRSAPLFSALRLWEKYVWPVPVGHPAMRAM